VGNITKVDYRYVLADTLSAEDFKNLFKYSMQKALGGAALSASIWTELIDSLTIEEIDIAKKYITFKPNMMMADMKGIRREAIN